MYAYWQSWLQFPIMSSRKWWLLQDAYTDTMWLKTERITEQKHLSCLSSLWKTEHGFWRWREKYADIINVKTPDEDEWISFPHWVCTFIPESKTFCMTLNWEGQVDKQEDIAVCHSVDLQQPGELGWQKTWRQMQTHATTMEWVQCNNVGWMLTGYNTALQKRTWGRAGAPALEH